MMVSKKYLIICAGVVGASAALIYLTTWFYRTSKDQAFHTATVQTGNLIATVTATGTIEPEEVVDVGAQIVGIVNEFGRDLVETAHPIDFGSAVESGTILARIDDTLYKARLDKASAVLEQTKAQVAQAEADLVRAEANVREVSAKFNQAARDFNRAQKLSATGALAEQDFDVAQASFEVAKAEVSVKDAAVRQAQAMLNSAKKIQLGAEADQREAQRNLEYTVIRSPVKGVIIDRRVNVGQTVVSSLNAPSLFLIAKDLTRLEVWASVNEADVGRIKKGQPVRFCVDAFPGEEFQGQVSQIRLNATMTQNVVTFTVVVATENRGRKLLPYLTATLKFEVGHSNQCLLVPNAALRWQPVSQSVKDQPQADRGTVWVLDHGSLKPVEIKTGLTDGLVTEVLDAQLEPGTVVVVGDQLPADASAAKSPFTPNLMGGRSR